MAGQLTISTLSDGTNSTSSTNCIQGSAKAWVNFSGATVNASYNVSSVTVNGTGQYTIAMTTALADANYAITGTAYIAASNQLTLNRQAGTAISASSFTVITMNYSTLPSSGAAPIAVTNAYVAVFR